MLPSFSKKPHKIKVPEATCSFSTGGVIGFVMDDSKVINPLTIRSGYLVKHFPLEEGLSSTTLARSYVLGRLENNSYSVNISPWRYQVNVNFPQAESSRVHRITCPEHASFSEASQLAYLAAVEIAVQISSRGGASLGRSVDLFLAHPVPCDDFLQR